MTKVIADITVSLDGFVTGPNAGPKAGLGDDGMPLHDWVFKGHEVDEAVLTKATARSGAVVMGRNLFDVVDGPDGWNDEIGYGAHNVGRPPFIVVTHNPPTRVRLGLDFTFVTEGVAGAIDAALAVCPPDKDLPIAGSRSRFAVRRVAGARRSSRGHRGSREKDGRVPLLVVAVIGRRPGTSNGASGRAGSTSPARPSL